MITGIMQGAILVIAGVALQVWATRRGLRHHARRRHPRPPLSWSHDGIEWER